VNANTFLSLQTLFLPAPSGNANTLFSLPILLKAPSGNANAFQSLPTLFLTAPSANANTFPSLPTLI
jgi:hypothetical protein